MAVMKITQEEVERVAQLARLAPAPDELRTLADELSAILGYVALLAEVDTSTVEPTAHAVVQQSAYRADVLRPSLTQELALEQAPASREGGFSVPKVLEVET